MQRYNFYIAWTCFNAIHQKIYGKLALANDIAYKTWYLFDYSADSVFSIRKRLSDPNSGYHKLTKRELTLLRRHGFSVAIGGTLMMTAALMQSWFGS